MTTDEEILVCYCGSKLITDIIDGHKYCITHLREYQLTPDMKILMKTFQTDSLDVFFTKKMLKCMKLARSEGFKDGYQECVKDINPKSYTGLLMAKIEKLENALRTIMSCDKMEHYDCCFCTEQAKKALQAEGEK